MVNASAHSATRTDKVPQLNATIRSDAYIQTISDWDRSGVFQVTAAYHSASSAYARPKWIKTAWQFNPTGINAGVTVGKSSASVGGYGSTSPGEYWKSSNGATTAWYRGRVGTTGFCIYLHTGGVRGFIQGSTASVLLQAERNSQRGRTGRFFTEESK